MKKGIAVVGAGINGLLTAFLISEKYKSRKIDVYDAEQHPIGASEHKGTTYGSKDARHLTGSESICFESSIHKDALRNPPGHKIRGWLLKDEAKLTDKEREWRSLFEASYVSSSGLSNLDFIHAELNYKGLAAWQVLVKKYPFIHQHMLYTDGVDVYFRNKSAFDDDVKMETEFCSRYFKNGQVKDAPNQEFDNLYTKKLVVPGMSIRVKSLATDLLQRLEANNSIRFHWGVTVKDAGQISAPAIVWTAGVTHQQPIEYLDHNVQGIVGCWVTIPNPGYLHPFKIATPTPSAYINVTPDGSELHISGGFGWVGGFTNTGVVKKIAKPMAEHFISQVNKYLSPSVKLEDLSYGIRPSTPSGQPLLLTDTSRGKTEIFITGSAKSGTTHAPSLSEYVIQQLNKDDLKRKKYR